VYFAAEMLASRGMTMEGKTATVSGSGNVAQYTVEKLNALGAKVVTLSDSGGTIVDEDGIDEEKWRFIMELKNIRRGRIKEYTDKFKKARYVNGERPWRLAKVDIALPSATQNELDLEDAKALVAGGCLCVSEGANMPATLEATEYLISQKVLFGPGKAANAGGVACSGLEMSQNSMRLAWPREEVDEKLRRIMVNIHAACRKAAQDYATPDNYVNGANIAGFKKVADAMLDQGLV